MQNGDRLKALRRATGLSVQQMADALGLTGEDSANKVRKMESGTRTISGPLLKLLELYEKQAGLDPQQFER